MSSYSEYLNRKKQRLPNIIDTRPHRDAGHQTEIVRMLAASGNLETARANTACTSALNTPSTVPTATNFFHGGGHNVQDMSSYVAYKAGAALATATAANTKTPQVTSVCYPHAWPSPGGELADRLANEPEFAAKYAARQGYKTTPNGNCCLKCNKVLFDSPCQCVTPTGLKDTYQYPRTVT